MERGNWTKVPNEVFDFLMKDLKGNEFKVFLTLIRLTTGFQKKSDRVTYDQLEERTGLARDSVWKALATLQSKNLVIKNTRGYSINYAQIVRKTDYLASNTEIVRKTDSTVRKTDSNSPKNGLPSLVQTVRKTDSQKTKETPFKETPPTKEVKEIRPGWEAAHAALVGLGVGPLIVSELLELAEERGRDGRYIQEIAGYVAHIDTAAKNPASMAIALIRRNESRIINAPERPLQSSSRPAVSKNNNNAIDFSKYEHGGSHHSVNSEKCRICHPELPPEEEY